MHIHIISASKNRAVFKRRYIRTKIELIIFFIMKSYRYVKSAKSAIINKNIYNRLKEI